MVPPDVLCNQHLLGEHVELHMFKGTIAKGISIKGYIEKGLVDVEKIDKRHEELVLEMQMRGMHHQSPLRTDVSLFRAGWVDEEKSLTTLEDRCEDCRERIGRRRWPQKNAIGLKKISEMLSMNRSGND
jgi:hypothetical protein